MRFSFSITSSCTTWGQIVQILHPAWWTFPYPFHQIEETIVTLEGMGEKKKQRKFVLASETTATHFKISRMSRTPLVLLRSVRIVACIKTRTREESLRFFLLRDGLLASENFIVLRYLSAAYFSYKKRKKKKTIHRYEKHK